MKLVAFLLAVFFGLASYSHAQDPEVERKSRQFSHYYEVLISQSLSRYYNNNSFLVDTRVVLADIGGALAEPDPAENAESAMESNAAGRNPDGLDALPGLPVLPDQMRPTQPQSRFHLDSLKRNSPAPSENTRRQLGILYIDILVLVDTLYSRQDLDFITEMIRMIAKIDDVRGDQIQVRKKIFPRLDRSLDEHRLRLDSTPHPVETLTVVDTVIAQAPPAHPWTLYWEQLPSLLPLLLILVFLTVIVALVVRGLRSTQIPHELIQRIGTGAQPALPPSPEFLPTSLPPSTPAPSAEDADLAQFETQRTICLNALIGDPAGGAVMLKNWIEADRSKGLSDVAIFIESLDSKVLDILRPHLPLPEIRSIQLQMDVQTMPPVLERTLLLKAFHKDLRTLRTRAGDGTIADIFGFLHQLSTPQLMHILKNEPVGIVGLALAQIPGERAGLILQQMDPDFRSEVLVAMGQIDTIPVQAYKEVANRLSRKALEVGNMRFVAADGVQTVLDIVQGLGLAEQSEYLRSVAERDLNLAGRLRRFYALFEELPTLPETVLVKVLNTFDRELLVSSLVGTETEFREKLTQCTPQRMRMAIESALQDRQEQSPLETERARKALLAAVRQELQSSGGRT